MTISIRWYYEADAQRWEKLETKDTIGPRQKKYLMFWRDAKYRHPGLKSIEVSGNACFLGEIDRKQDAREMASRWFKEKLFSELPIELTKTLRAVGKEVGHSGNVFIDVTTAWIYDGERNILNADDVMRIMKDFS